MTDFEGTNKATTKLNVSSAKDRFEFADEPIETPKTSAAEVAQEDQPVGEPSLAVTACRCCGYRGRLMIEESGFDTTTWVCRECDVYERPRIASEEFQLAWLPHYSKESVSVLCKLIGLTEYSHTVAALSSLRDLDKPEIKKLYPEHAAVEAILHRFKKEAEAEELPAGTITAIAKAFKEFAKPVKADFNEGLKIARELFEEMNADEALAVINASAPEVKERLLAGLRFIPIAILGSETNTADRVYLRWTILNEIEERLASNDLYIPGNLEVEVSSKTDSVELGDNLEDPIPDEPPSVEPISERANSLALKNDADVGEVQS